MPSVSELVEDVADIMKEAPETVNAYARALIDSGILPKSKGRNIAQVLPSHIVALFAAVCLEPKIKETAEVVEKYLALRVAQFTAGQFLQALVETILTKPDNDEDDEARKKAFDSEIVFVRSWHEITVRRGGDTIFSFNNGELFWAGYHKTETVLSGRAFLILAVKEDGKYLISSVK